MTDLDMDALTAHQRDVLSAIAVGQDAGHHRRTIDALERRGYIVGYDQQVADPLGHLTIRRWDVPVDVHMQWAAWCSTQLDEAED